MTINGVVDFTAQANSTLTAADNLAPAGGTNILNITNSGAANATNALNGSLVSGIQTINLRTTTAGTVTVLAATNAAGATAVNANLALGITTVTALASGATAGVIGNGLLANGASNFGWGATVTAATLNVSGGVTAGAVALTGTLLATQTVNSTGAANVLTSLTLDTATTALNINSTTALTTGAITNAAGAALATVTVTGAGATTIASLGAGVATLNASAATGALTVTLGSNVAQVVTGGSGNDVITTGAILTTGSVNAGAGTADVLVVGNVNQVNTSTLAAKYTNFEVLRVNGTLDASLVAGITSVQLSGATNAITNLSATQAAAISARASIGDTTLTLATATGTTDVLTITNGLGTTTAAATTIGTLTATGFETINLIANPGASATTGAARTSSITAIADTSLTAVNLTGTAWTLGDIASTKATTWTATNLTGNGASTPVGLTLTTTGAAFAGSVVNGSAFRDSVIMTTSTGVTFNLAGGNDIFSTTTTLLLPSGAATDNTVNGGDGTNDQLVFTGAATATDTTFTKVTGFESLELAGAGVVNSVTGLAAGFLSAFAGGVTVTDTAAQTGASAYTWASGLYSQNVTLTHATTYTGDLVGGSQTITTGAGTDSITFSDTLWIAGTTGAIAVSTGAGNDTIAVTTGTLVETSTVRAITITGGTGADTITLTHGIADEAGTAEYLNNASFVIASGDSTTTAYDLITGFLVGTADKVSDVLDFTAARVTTYVATAASGYSAAELTVAVAATGAVTFAGTSASTLTVAQKISAIQSVVTATAGDSAFFVDSTNTYVFNNETAVNDVVVELVGTTATTLVLTGLLSVDAGAVLIA